VIFFSPIKNQIAGFFKGDSSLKKQSFFIIKVFKQVFPLFFMKISNQKKDKISEQILAFLYSINPKPLFTSHIAQEIARDEEFVKKILLNMKSKGLVIEIRKNPHGVPYKTRSRWKLTNLLFEAYKKHQQAPK